MRGTFLVGLACIAFAGPAYGNPSEAVDRAITDASETFAIPQSWIRAVIAVESTGNARALSKSGAIGLMQIMPKTWAVLRQRLHLGANPYDPHDNVMAGAALLRNLYERFGPGGFLAAYNAGPQRYLDYLTTGRPLSDETRAYLARIAPLLGDARLARAVAAPAASTDWRTASLFVAGETSASQAPQGNPEASPSRFGPPSNTLFAAALQDTAQ